MTPVIHSLPIHRWNRNRPSRYRFTRSAQKHPDSGRNSGQTMRFDIDIWSVLTLSTTLYTTEQRNPARSLTSTVDLSPDFLSSRSAEIHSRYTRRWVYIQSKPHLSQIGTCIFFPSGIDLTGSFGIQYQDPDYADLVATKQNKNLKPRKATTGILGAEYLLKKISAKTVVETYYKQYDDLPVEEALMTPDSLDKSDVLLSVGKGRSYGIEFFIQKKLTRNFFFTAAYSLSRSEYLDPRPGRENQWYRGDFDFRNALTVTGGCKIDLIEKEWYKKVHDSWWLIALSPVIPIADRVELSAKWRYLGGRPRTQPVWNKEYERWVLNQHDLNSSQYPDYHRLDLRFERRYGFGFLHMIYYFDLQNIYNKENIWNYMYSNHHASETPIYQFSFFRQEG